MHINIEVLRLFPGKTGKALVKFAVDGILDRKHKNFHDDLLFALNILQENTGVANVYSSDTKRDEFIRTITLDWKVFPSGTAEEIISSFSKSRKSPSPAQKTTIQERLKLFSKLKPTAYLRGIGSFGSYIGAQYADNLVVFENLNYGNALYVLYDDWKDVSKRSRLDLLKGTNAHYDRFIHKDDWEERFLERFSIRLHSRRF